MDTLKGFLFCKLDRIGTRSEGPEYFLQQDDYTEIKIIKKATPWEEDPDLHPMLATKITLDGTIEEGAIIYAGIAKTTFSAPDIEK